MIENFKISSEYAKKLFKDDKDILEIKIAIKDNIPIISEEALMFMILIKSNNFKNALEIGSATGYSGLYLSKYLHLTTIEIDEQRYEVAKQNFEKLHRKVKIICGDAVDVLDTIDDKFDFIFIDASKGQYMKFFEKAYPKLNKNGLIFIDNILFRSYVGSYNYPKKYSTIVKRLDQFITHLNENYNFVLLPFADGIGLVRKDLD